jgi:hypothetical protein
VDRTIHSPPKGGVPEQSGGGSRVERESPDMRNADRGGSWCNGIFRILIRDVHNSLAFIDLH